MRRILARALLVASVPLGAGVGLWMAQLTRPPDCPVRGLGTLALCVPRSLFEPSVCVLYGAAAAAVLLLASIGVHRSAAKVGIFDLAAAEAGIVIGLWTSLLTYASCGPLQLCIGFLAQRFAIWQSSLIGATATMVILMVGAAANSDLRHMNMSAARSVSRWLFRDLSSFDSMGGPKSHAG